MLFVVRVACCLRPLACYACSHRLPLDANPCQSESFFADVLRTPRVKRYMPKKLARYSRHLDEVQTILQKPKTDRRLVPAISDNLCECSRDPIEGAIFFLLTLNNLSVVCVCVCPSNVDRSIATFMSLFTSIHTYQTVSATSIRHCTSK